MPETGRRAFVNYRHTPFFTRRCALKSIGIGFGATIATGMLVEWLAPDTIWQLIYDQSICTFKGHTSSVASVAFSPDGRSVLSGSYDKTLKLWDVTTGKELRSFVGHTDFVFSVAFSPDGPLSYPVAVTKR